MLNDTKLSKSLHLSAMAISLLVASVSHAFDIPEITLDDCPERIHSRTPESVNWSQYVGTWFKVTYDGCGFFRKDSTFLSSSDSLVQKLLDVSAMDDINWRLEEPGFIRKMAEKTLLDTKLSGSSESAVWVIRNRTKGYAGKIFHRKDGKSLQVGDLMARLEKTFSGQPFAGLEIILVRSIGPTLRPLGRQEIEIMNRLEARYGKTPVRIYGLPTASRNRTFFAFKHEIDEPVWVTRYPSDEDRVKLTEKGARLSHVYLEKATARLSEGRLPESVFQKYGISSNYFTHYLRTSLSLDHSLELVLRSTEGEDFDSCGRDGLGGGTFAATLLYPVDSSPETAPEYQPSKYTMLCDYVFRERLDAEGIAYVLLHELDHYSNAEPDEVQATLTGALAYVIATGRTPPIDLYANLELEKRIEDLQKSVTEYFNGIHPSEVDTLSDRAPYRVRTVDVR